MKKALFLLLLLPLFGYGQMTLQHIYNNVNMVHFSQNGFKFVETDSGSIDWIKLYDSPSTLWKTINIPSYNGYVPTYVTAISDNLFNSDNLIEYAVTYKHPTQYEYILRVYNENSSLLGEIANGYYATPMQIDENDGYKLMVTMYLSNGQGGYFTQVNQYTVPGTLPCISCGNLKASNTTKQQPYISEPIPNPSTGQVTITYILPPGEAHGEIRIISTTGTQIATYQVTADKPAITIQTGSLMPGTYLYTLSTGSTMSEAKRLIIAK